MFVKGTKLFVVIWEFVPRQGSEKEFEKIYSSSGLWTELFKQASDYLETILLKKIDSENIYLVVNKWKSKEAYDSFKIKYFEEYHSIDLRCKQFTAAEVLIGKFQTKG